MRGARQRLQQPISMRSSIVLVHQHPAAASLFCGGRTHDRPSSEDGLPAQQTAPARQNSQQVVMLHPRSSPKHIDSYSTSPAPHPPTGAPVIPSYLVK